MAEPSRRNSGLQATCTGVPAACFSRISRQVLMVPAGTVLRMITECAVLFFATARPMLSHTPKTADRSSSPPGLLGVPTVMRETSELRMAWGASVVALMVPFWIPAARSSESPSSMSGACPEETIRTLSGFSSTPMTYRPSRARQAALTAPTYPSPKILTFMMYRDHRSPRYREAAQSAPSHCIARLSHTEHR